MTIFEFDQTLTELSSSALSGEITYREYTKKLVETIDEFFNQNSERKTADLLAQIVSYVADMRLAKYDDIMRSA